MDDITIQVYEICCADGHIAFSALAKRKDWDSPRFKHRLLRKDVGKAVEQLLKLGLIKHVRDTKTLDGDLSLVYAPTTPCEIVKAKKNERR